VVVPGGGVVVPGGGVVVTGGGVVVPGGGVVVPGGGVVVPGGGVVVPGGGVVVGIAELAAVPAPLPLNALAIAGIPSKAAAAIGSIFLKASKKLARSAPLGGLIETSPIVASSISRNMEMSSGISTVPETSSLAIFSSGSRGNLDIGSIAVLIFTPEFKKLAVLFSVVGMEKDLVSNTVRGVLGSTNFSKYGCN